MTRILLLDPVGVGIHGDQERKVAQQAVGRDTTVEVRHLDGLPGTVFVPPEPVVTPELAAAAQQAEADGFDAIGIACCADPGLQAVRDAVAIPVTAPFESLVARVSASAALQPLSVFFNVAPAGPGEATFTWQDWGPARAQRHGIAGLLAAPQAINVRRPTVEFGRQDAAAEVGAALIEAMRTGLVENGTGALREAEAAGARGVFLACTYWAGLTDVLQEQTGLQVLDPIGILAEHTEEIAQGV